MNLIRMSLYLSACAILTSVLVEHLLPVGIDLPVSTPYWIAAGPTFYGTQEETINVTFEDIVEVGSRMGFDLAGVEKSPTILVPGTLELENALISALAQCPAGITMEQYCHASDLLGFLDLGNGTPLGSARYGILSPYRGFYLNITLTDPPEYRLSYPPSADVSGSIYTRMRAGVLGPEPAEELQANAEYRVKNVRQEPELRCSDLGCLEGEKVAVELSHAVYFSTGHVFESSYTDLEFFFANHPGCETRRLNGVVVEHCRDGESGYRARVWIEDCSDGNAAPVFKIHGYLTRAEISYRGYHGNSTKLIADCYQLVKMHYSESDEKWYYLGGTAEIQLQNGSESIWSGKVFIPIFHCAECATEVSCGLYLSDFVLTPVIAIERKCPAGSFRYHYRPPYCEPEGKCIVEPAEYSEFLGTVAAEHARQPYSCSSNAAEEFMLRAIAETIKAKTEGKIKIVLENAVKEGSWGKYFGELDEKGAKELLQYFYLIQIPLNIERDDFSNFTKLEAIVKRKAKADTIYGLAVFVENTTRLNVSETLCNVNGNWSMAANCRVFLIQLDVEKFGKKLYDSFCGKYFVSELVQIRKPSIDDATKYIKIPERIRFALGYSPSPGVEYRQMDSCEI